jgi:Fe-S-cluster containining protein
MKLNKTKLGRFLNSFFNYDKKKRIGTCKSTECETLSGEKGNACCKLGYTCFFSQENKCNIYNLRPRNCRVFPANKEDLKLVKNCSYTFK